jgi:hypothetical protein
VKLSLSPRDDFYTRSPLFPSLPCDALLVRRRAGERRRRVALSQSGKRAILFRRPIEIETADRDDSEKACAYRRGAKAHHLAQRGRETTAMNSTGLSITEIQGDGGGDAAAQDDSPPSTPRTPTASIGERRERDLTSARDTSSSTDLVDPSPPSLFSPLSSWRRPQPPSHLSSLRTTETSKRNTPPLH